MQRSAPLDNDPPPRLPRRRLARLVARAYGGRPPLWLPDRYLKQVARAAVEDVACSPHSLTRFAMYEALAGRLAAADSATASCLSISASNRLARILGLGSAGLVGARYPEHSLLALRFEDGTFDACVSDQVLEHVEGNPFEAVKESLRVVRPGGFVVHTTCLVNPVHGYPGDFWRFTPEALALLCEAAGASEIETGGWGNKTALRLVLAGARGTPVPLDPSHPMHQIAVRSDRTWLIHTWVVARKPERP
jgi:SAM-dependent methyltransferase